MVKGEGSAGGSHELETQGVLASTLGYNPGIRKIKIQRNPGWHVPSPDGSEIEQLLKGSKDNT